MKIPAKCLRIGLVSIYFAIFLIIYYKHQGIWLTDVGRELYVPSQLLKGQLLYKDIFVLYGPLSYQLNSLLYLVLSNHIDTLCLAGLVTTSLILLILYRLARFLLEPWWAALCLVWVILFCLAGNLTFSYITPYAYAIIYGLLAYLGSIFFLMKSIHNQNQKMLQVAFILAGAAAACKFEYLAALPLLFVASAYTFKPFRIKQGMIMLAGYFFIPVLSWGLLFAQGLTFSDLAHYLKDLNAYLGSPSFQYFTQATGLIPSKRLFANPILAGLKILLLFTIASALLYKLLQSISNRRQSDLLLWGLVSFVALPFIWMFGMQMLSSGEAFSLAPLWVFSVVLIQSLLRWRKKAADSKDDLLILSLAAVLLSIRAFWSLNINGYGVYCLPLLLNVVLYHILHLPQIFPKLNQKQWRSICLTILLVLTLSSSWLVFFKRPLEQEWIEVHTAKGDFYTDPYVGSALEQSALLIRQIKLPANSTVLVLPEGTMLNWMVDYPSNNYFYSLLPCFVEGFGEERIIQTLRLSPPAIIALHDRRFIEYGASDFGQDYGKRLYHYILSNYEPLTKISVRNQFAFTVKLYRFRGFIPNVKKNSSS